MDWVSFLVSAIVGLVAVVGSLENPKADIWVMFVILSTVVGYCAKIYLTFQANMASYQNLITKSMYDKQLDSGKGTLLQLCDDVVQQELSFEFRQPVAAKKSPAAGAIAPSNPVGKVGNKKGGTKDPKQGNILSFFKKV